MSVVKNLPQAVIGCSLGHSGTWILTCVRLRWNLDEILDFRANARMSYDL